MSSGWDNDGRTVFQMEFDVPEKFCITVEGEMKHEENEKLKRIKDKQQWQPIETAPDPDDENFLITDGNLVVMALKDDDGHWICHQYPDDYNTYDIAPTHWMPLPDASSVK